MYGQRGRTAPSKRPRYQGWALPAGPWPAQSGAVEALVREMWIPGGSRCKAEVAHVGSRRLRLGWG